MAAGEEKKVVQKNRMGSVTWSSTETERFFQEVSSVARFTINGYDYCLNIKRYKLRDLGWYTTFYIDNSNLPEGIFLTYGLCLLDSEENVCYITTGSIRNKSANATEGSLPVNNTLMTVSADYLNYRRPAGGKLRLSIAFFERCAVSDKCIQVKPDEDDTALLDTLSNDYRRYYESKTDTDCVLKVGNAEFPVHRQVLSARSEVFGSMFRHGTSESRSGTVDIQDIEADVMSDILFYVYSGKTRSLTADDAISMYVGADKYALLELSDKCMNFLLHNLTLENVCDAAVLAHTHGVTELENKVVMFIAERLKELMDNANWKHFLKNKSLLASRLLCSALLANK